ncbi:MAG: mechanosensitive ion channel family protein [Candidatus Aenigmatarchaeota archaeon]
MALGGTLAILEGTWQSFLAYLPGLIGALVLLIIGWIVGRVVAKVVKEILIRADVDEYIKKEGSLNFELSSIMHVVVKWFIYLAFISAATSALGIAGVTQFVDGILFNILPGIVGAGIVLLVAYMVGIYFKDSVAKKETIYSDLSGKVIFWLSMFFGVALALDIFFRHALQIAGVNLLPNILLILAASIGVGIAIALGLGMKDVVNTMAKDYAKEFKKKRK